MENAENVLPEESPRYALNLNLFRIPNDEKLKLAYNVYQPSEETLELKTELQREIYPEAFLQNHVLGTLADLCVTTLSQQLGPKGLHKLVREHPLQCRIFYDCLDIESPLEECYVVEDESYWRRVVLAKSKDKSLIFKKSFNWKSAGISLKFVELVEACPAAYWPKDEMQPLALLVKDFVTEMDISKLQALEEESFVEHYDSDMSSTEDESELSSSSDELEEDEQIRQTEEQLRKRFERAERRRIRKAQHEEKWEAIRKRHEEREIRRAAKYLSPPETPDEEEEPPAPVKKKRKRRKKIKGVFDIEIQEESDHEKEYEDKRNLALALKKNKNYKYPSRHCHHINLSFIRFFEHLVSFSIQFQGPELQRGYHTKYFNFSYDDVKNLSRGLSSLKFLKTFRLRNSRMNAKKVNIIVKTLMILEELETVDFGYDQLLDDCEGIADILYLTTGIKYLELEGNFLGPNVMKKLAGTLEEYTGILEYIGLAGNPLDDDGLHSLASVLIGTEHVKKLCLNGIEVSQKGIICCIANELIGKHTTLRELDFLAVPTSFEAAEEIQKALVKNTKLLHFDCRGCGLDYDLEFEIELLIRRNNYIVEHPYIGDMTKTKEEILEYARRIKNPSLLEVFKLIEDRKICLEERPDFVHRLSERPSSVYFDISEDDSDPGMRQYISRVETQEPFVFKPNEFNMEQFLTHIHVPGPKERYYYFKAMKINSHLD